MCDPHTCHGAGPGPHEGVIKNIIEDEEDPRTAGELFGRNVDVRTPDGWGSVISQSSPWTEDAGGIGAHCHMMRLYR